MDRAAPLSSPEEPEPSEQDSSGQDGAEAAFEALRAEVAGLRHGIELVYRQAQDAKPPVVAAPDYSPTLGAIAKELQAVTARLQAIERTPVLSMTPASLGADIDQVAQATVSVVSQPFRQGMAELRGTTRELQALAGRVREQHEQQQWLWTVGILGTMLGMLLWFLATALLPWGAGTWLGSLAYGGRWNAGQAMLQDAQPALWGRMVRLYNACPKDSTTELCEAAMTVRTIPHAGPAPTPPGRETRSGNGQRPGSTDRRPRQ